MHEKQYVYLLCAILYGVALSWSCSHAERWLRSPQCKPQPRLKLSDAHFCTGDVLLWSSPPTLRTDVEKLVCGSQHTHVALVFVDASGHAFAWECVRSGHQVVRITPHFVQKHGTCFWRRISKPVDSAALERFILQNMHQPYSFDLWRGVVRRWCSTLYLPQSVESRAFAKPRFCSELVADSLVAVGALDFTLCTDLTPVTVMPHDFSDSCTSALPWTHGFGLSGEVQLMPV